MRTIYLGGLLVIVLSSASVGAHHAVQGQFDLSKTIMLEGKCLKMEWINPHAYMHLSVTDQSGATKTWQLETVGPTALRRAGLSRGDNSIKCDPLGGGGTYVIKGFPARNGTNTALVAELTLHDGRIVKVLDVEELQLPANFQVK